MPAVLHIKPVIPLIPFAAPGDEDADPLRSAVDFTHPRPMRVCFPVLLDGDLVVSSEHLGVSYLVAILRRLSIDCRIVEVPAGGAGDAAAIERIRAFRPDLVGLSLTTVSISHATAFGHALRAHLGPATAFLAGGPLATSLGSQLLRNPNWSFLDALVRGEGDVPLVRYVEALWQDSDFANVPALSWRRAADDCVDNPVGRTVVELDMLPEAMRDQYEANDGRLSSMRVATTRGCSGSCAFCNAPHAGNKINGGKLWRTRSTARILDEIERLHRQYRVDTFEFVDSTFEDPGGGTLGKRRIGAIAQGMLDRGLHIHYSCCTQARSWHEADRPLLALLHRSGLEKVLIGIESGSQRGLDRWNKKSTVEDNIRAIGLLRGAGIHVEFGFIAYHPWSSFDEIYANNAFLHRFLGQHLRRYTTPLELYPGASVLDTLRAERLLHDDYALSLDPFAYDFQDARIAALAASMPLLFRKDAASTDGALPPVFEFERNDPAFSLRLSRLKRRAATPAGARAITAAEAGVRALRDALAEFNLALISRLTLRAEQGVLTEADVLAERPAVDARYRAALNALRTLDAELAAGWQPGGGRPAPDHSIPNPTRRSDHESTRA
ncbi:B12-binding domain-containing radical SAM protein [Burkholderia ubonensis]|uniref:Radical SAM protein n=1 Tax=Burkholderia ubonensis TaxID=101571 RepID=A0ABD4DTJ5_9BURK|nr:radical SAM protein [Burkholderia ubonensis]KVN74892.1 hypothetical protein WJ68_27625 [Burkholderia ubonensis]KVN92689.1 hypothetical protein WJ69_09710 [Burkholderia ubonensis]KVO06864.1 hypothetical protein WJ71_09165 [Burkholderia ubonensis]KVO17958.1 hypothetical protein WJ73_06920 [Burkholderia ubonensis]KVO46169.1 hypothetical protein WJ76_30605 [Burkholderia ubonensis]